MSSVWIAREANPLEDSHGRKGTSVFHGQTNILISGPGLDVLQKSGRDPYAVCLRGIGTNAIFCGDCYSWVHRDEVLQLGPQEMKCNLWSFKAWSQLKV